MARPIKCFHMDNRVARGTLTVKPSATATTRGAAGPTPAARPAPSNRPGRPSGPHARLSCRPASGEAAAPRSQGRPRQRPAPPALGGGAAPKPKTAAHGRSTRIQRALGPNKPHSRRAKQATYLPEPKFCARGLSRGSAEGPRPTLTGGRVDEASARRDEPRSRCGGRAMSLVHVQNLRFSHKVLGPSGSMAYAVQKIRAK
jgi:hypothetical protein